MSPEGEPCAEPNFEGQTARFHGSVLQKLVHSQRDTCCRGIACDDYVSSHNHVFWHCELLSQFVDDSDVCLVSDNGRQIVRGDSGNLKCLLGNLDHFPHKKTTQRSTGMRVIQARDRTPVRPDCVYVIPPNRDMSILHGVLHLLGHDHAEPEEHERMFSLQAELLQGWLAVPR